MTKRQIKRLQKALLTFVAKLRRVSLSSLQPSQAKSVNMAVFNEKQSAIIIPTYKPNETTLELVKFIRKHNPTVHVVLVNDCIPHDAPEYQIFVGIEKWAKRDKLITCLYTTKNTHKAGALNLGIEYVLKSKKVPDVIFTCDDDIMINAKTLPLMVETLFSKSNLGAVCSRCLVKNKHVNVLTRLQALEYFGFTVTKIADNSFLHGPLVMQGMLAGFRSSTLQVVNGFTPHHLIEDYDITVRVKKAGWKVAIAKEAQAWTLVPESLSDLWRQRVRWGYWGMKVVAENVGFLHAIFQDFVGHSVFIGLMILIIISLIFYEPQTSTNILIPGILLLSFVQFVLSYLFGLVTMVAYEDRDRMDWVLRWLFIPELIYSNMITLVLFGCYVYLIYNVTMDRITKRFSPFHRVHAVGLKGFARVGYASHWGTRTQGQ